MTMRALLAFALLCGIALVCAVAYSSTANFYSMQCYDSLNNVAYQGAAAANGWPDGLIQLGRAARKNLPRHGVFKCVEYAKIIGP